LAIFFATAITPFSRGKVAGNFFWSPLFSWGQGGASGFS
jgi:hypothetical protein